MKVLFLSNEEGSNRAGSAYVHRLEKLRSALDARGISTAMIGLKEQRIGHPLLVQPLNIPALRNRVKDWDFIHAGGDAAYTASLLRPFTRARIVFDVHGDGLDEAKLKWSDRPGPRSLFWVFQAAIVGAVAYRSSDYFLVVSRPSKARLARERGISPDRVGLIRNGVDLELFTPPDDVSIADEFTVCYAGGFQSWQGVENLVQAFERMPAGRIRLKIIGFSPETANIRAEIASRLGGKAELLDRMPQKELISHWAAASVLVIPRARHRAVEVALPTKFGEYLSLGKPVIVSDVDDTAALVREYRCGLVAEPGPAGLLMAIEKAAELPAEELAEMGRRGRPLAEEQFSWEVLGDRYLEMLNRWSRQ